MRPSHNSARRPLAGFKNSGVVGCPSTAANLVSTPIGYLAALRAPPSASSLKTSITSFGVPRNYGAG